MSHYLVDQCSDLIEANKHLSVSEILKLVEADGRFEFLLKDVRNYLVFLTT